MDAREVPNAVFTAQEGLSITELRALCNLNVSVKGGGGGK